MAHERRPKAWWREALARWKRSGLTAEEFAELEGVRAGTLRWWSSQLRHGTRAKHGSSALIPLEIALPSDAVRTTAGTIEIVVGEAVVRCDIGADIEYVVALVVALRGS